MSPDANLPDECPYCGHDGFMRLDCTGRLAKPPTPGVWWCEACGAAIEPRFRQEVADEAS